MEEEDLRGEVGVGAIGGNEESDLHGAHDSHRRGEGRGGEKKHLTS